jgi:hypothetical protein
VNEGGAVKAPCSSPACRQVSKLSQRVTWNNAGKAYQDSLRKNLEHRLEVARNQGDQKLIEQLEKEAAYLHLMK